MHILMPCGCREEEVREHISWFREFLTFGTELPETIRRQVRPRRGLPAIHGAGGE